jgi:hypothetical protein
MANAITTITKYAPLLDEVYKQSAKTAMLDAPSVLVKETQIAGTFLVAKMALDGLGDYSRATGFVDGDATLTWESHTFSQDRGRSFSIDNMDNLETADIGFGMLSGKFIRTEVVPELDAYRFATMAAAAETTVSADLTSSTTVEAIDAGTIAMDDAEVTEEGRILFCTSTMLKNIQNSDLFTRNVDVTASSGINRTVDMFDGMEVVKVPQARFYTAIDLNDGTTVGEEAGGFSKAAVGGFNLNFMIVDPNAVVSLVKHAKVRTFSPDVNQKKDAYKYDYRVYYDLFSLENKTDGIYLHTVAQV